jgi:hypothetical protein
MCRGQRGTATGGLTADARAVNDEDSVATRPYALRRTSGADMSREMRRRGTPLAAARQSYPNPQQLS